MARDPNNNVRQQYEKTLGSELGSLFSELWQELTYLQIVWREYRVLFGNDPKTIELLNQSAGLFALVIQKSLWEGVLLHLARLTDPAEVRGKSNLSVLKLTSLVRPELVSSVDDLITKVLAKTTFARDWRNRYIAHRDLPLALGQSSASRLEAASRASVEGALESLRDLLNHIDHEYNQTTTVFEGVPPHNGSERLLHLLREGVQAERLKRDEVLRMYEGN